MPKTLQALSVVLITSSSAMATEPADPAHDKLAVLDVKIGMPIEGRPGYTCLPDKRTASGERQDRHCVKFTDERCKGRPANLGYHYGSVKVPAGCYRDYSSKATYLDGLLLQDPHSGATDQPHNGRKPLWNVLLVGTESTPSLIYRIVYTFGEDDLLAESSKLHKALVAKYGEPREIHSGKMRWKINSTELVAQCIENQNCEIEVEDSTFETRVEDEQKAADAQKKRGAAPDPQL